jgi:hypothetical protein
VIADDVLSTIVGIDQRAPTLLDLITTRQTDGDQVSSSD